MVVETEKTKDSKLSSTNAKAIKWVLIMIALFMLVILVVELKAPPKTFAQGGRDSAQSEPQTAINKNRFGGEDPFAIDADNIEVPEIDTDYKDRTELSSYREPVNQPYFGGSEEEAVRDSGFSVSFKGLGNDNAREKNDFRADPYLQSNNPMDEISSIDAEISKIDSLINHTESAVKNGTYLNGLSNQGAVNNSANQTKSAKNNDSKYGYYKPNHCNNLRAGTVIKGYVDQYLSSDYPNGNFLGRITHTVYDPSGQNALILQGDKFIGQQVSTNNKNEIIEERVGIAVNKILFNDGSYFDLGGLTAGDIQGIGALPASDVNRHLLAKFAGLVAYALVGTSTSYEGSGQINDSSFESELGAGVREQVKGEANKYLSLTNTRTLKQGTPLTVIIQQGVCLPVQKKVRVRYENY